MKKEEKAAAAEGTKSVERLAIKAPQFRVITFRIRGTAPLVMHKFSEKVQQQIADTQKQGTQMAGGKKIRAPKDFDEIYKNAQHVSTEGWHGIPAGAFRNAAISACRTVGYKMTHAKLAFFIMADGYEADSGTPLVRITKGEPRKHTGYARNANGNPDIRVRPMWEPGWEAQVRVRFDSDMFAEADVANLMMRVGMQVGLLEGRPDSKESAGMGWGTFELVEGETVVQAA